MPKKYIVFFKSIGRQWFLILIVVIIIVAFFQLVVAIWMAVITLILFMFTYIGPILFNSRLKSFLNKQKRIEDKEIAHKLNRPLQKIQEKMYKLSSKQDKKDWLIIFHNKTYIFYSKDIVKKFKSLVNKNLSEKEILEKVTPLKINTRAEVKSIKETLLKLNK